ncbi:MAG TPA: retropepsin-like aspartic protease [Pirellulales bacterium]
MPPAKISFNYRIVFREAFPAPIIPVEIVGPSGRKSLDVLVDSGAAWSIFPVSAAEEVGIVAAAAPKVSVIYGGGEVEGRMVRYPLIIGGHRIDSAIMVFVEKLVYPYGLMGRNNVFGQFREVAFLQRLPRPRVEFRFEGEK